MKLEKHKQFKPAISINDVARFQRAYDEKYGEQISYTSAAKALEDGITMVKARHRELKAQGRWKSGDER